jgi:hypothetical protein
MYGNLEDGYLLYQNPELLRVWPYWNYKVQQSENCNAELFDSDYGPTLSPKLKKESTRDVRLSHLSEDVQNEVLFEAQNAQIMYTKMYYNYCMEIINHKFLFKKLPSTWRNSKHKYTKKVLHDVWSLHANKLSVREIVERTKYPPCQVRRCIDHVRDKILLNYIKLDQIISTVEELNMIEHLESLLLTEIASMKRRQNKAPDKDNAASIRHLMNSYKDMQAEKRLVAREEAGIDCLTDEERLDALVAILNSLTDEEKKIMYKMISD